MLNPNDARLCVLFLRLLDGVHAQFVHQKREPTEAEEERGGREGQGCAQSVGINISYDAQISSNNFPLPYQSTNRIIVIPCTQYSTRAPIPGAYRYEFHKFQLAE